MQSVRQSPHMENHFTWWRNIIARPVSDVLICLSARLTLPPRLGAGARGAPCFGCLWGASGGGARGARGAASGGGARGCRVRARGAPCRVPRSRAPSAGCRVPPLGCPACRVPSGGGARPVWGAPLGQGRRGAPLGAGGRRQGRRARGALCRTCEGRLAALAKPGAEKSLKIKGFGHAAPQRM